MAKLPNHIMKNIREALGFDAEDERHDDEIIANRSASELFDLWCNFEGLINYGTQIATTWDCLKRIKMEDDPALDALKKIHNEEGTVWTADVIKKIEPTWKSKWTLLAEEDARQERMAEVEEAEGRDITEFHSHEYGESGYCVVGSCKEYRCICGTRMTGIEGHLASCPFYPKDGRGESVFE